MTKLRSGSSLDSGSEDGGIAMIDPKTDERVGEIFKTGGHPESFQVEATGGHIFVNVPDAGNVVESIDRKTGAVTKWPLKGLRANYAMALNEEDHRLFTITRKTPMLVVLNTETGSEIARLRAAGECDDVFFESLPANGMRCASNVSKTRSFVTTTAPRRSKQRTTRSKCLQSRSVDQSGLRHLFR